MSIGKAREARLGDTRVNVRDYGPPKFLPCRVIKVKERGIFGSLLPQAWAALHDEMLRWAIGANIGAGHNETGFRLVLDFSGFGKGDAEQTVKIYLLSAAPDAANPLTWNDFTQHDPDNVLYHIANQRTDKFPWIGERIKPHPSSNDSFLVVTDGNPQAVIHSLAIAKGPYSCPTSLPVGQWGGLGVVLSAEIANLGSTSALERFGYRILMNNGPSAQGVAQMHAHLFAGTPRLPRFPLPRPLVCH